MSRSDTITWSMVCILKTQNKCFCWKLLNFQYLRKIGHTLDYKCGFKSLLHLLKKPTIRCDPLLKVYQYVKDNGFVLQKHEVLTHDGYKLTVHRLVQPDEKPVQNPQSPKSNVIYLQHGLMCCSADWMVPGGLAYVLAQKGYDVWMGNFRGNVFSLNHTYLNYKSKDFWRYSWDEHGTVDLPAMIKYVMEYTKVPKIRYIGHSMGTTSLFVMLNEYPEMNRVIDYCVALAPVSCVPNMQGIQGRTIHWVFLGLKIVKMFNIYNMNFYKGYFVPKLMELSALYSCGFHSASYERFDQIVDFTPAGTSVFTITQYVRNHFLRDFYSRDGTHVYRLSHVKCPITSWYSKLDWASCETDAYMVNAQLGSKHREVKEVPLEDYGHLDFLWDPRSAEGLYDLIAKDMARYDY